PAAGEPAVPQRRRVHVARARAVSRQPLPPLRAPARGPQRPRLDLPDVPGAHASQVRPAAGAPLPRLRRPRRVIPPQYRVMKQSGIIVVVFVFGCATGGVAAQLVVPAVRAGTSPTRWEYQCATVGKNGGITAALNQLGAQGWELASTAPAHQGPVFGG